MIAGKSAASAGNPNATSTCPTVFTVGALEQNVTKIGAAVSLTTAVDDADFAVFS
jgi:hypothetical protein